jgi:hypothetical protein
MCLDLNKIVLYGNPDGSFRPPLPQNRKRHYALVDGILAGQGRGPLNPDPVAAGVVLFGVHPPSVDTACAYSSWDSTQREFRLSRGAFQSRGLPLADHKWRDVEVCSNHAAWNGPLVGIPSDQTFHFEPHFGWKGRIENTSTSDEDTSAVVTSQSMSESLMVEQIYPRLPVFLQNAACWYYGKKEARTRFGRTFEQRLRELMESEKWSPAEIEAYQNEQLRYLIRSAYENVPYYRERWKSLKVSPDDIRCREDLAKLPVLTKEDVRQNVDRLVSQAIPTHELIFRHTSGTTGKALRFYVTKAKDRLPVGPLVEAPAAFRNRTWKLARELHRQEGCSFGPAPTALLALEPPHASGADYHASPRAFEDREYR